MLIVYALGLLPILQRWVTDCLVAASTALPVVAQREPAGLEGGFNANGQQV